MKTRKLTLTALMTAVALGIFVAEAQIPFMPSIPGISWAFANVVTVFAMYLLGPGATACIVLVRVTLGCFATGQLMAFLYSMAGGLLALCISTVLSHFFPVNKMWVVSVFAAIAHNIGQLAIAVAITETPAIAYYLPALVLSGTITGAFTGFCAQFTYQRLSNNFQKYI